MKTKLPFYKTIWFRIVISLFGGGMVSEIIHISTGDPNRPMTSNYSLVYALFIYGILSLFFDFFGSKK